MAITIIDSQSSVATLVDSLQNLPTNPPSLYLDLEGINLSRNGLISIMQIFVQPTNQVYLLDIFVLREKAFDTPGTSGTDLRAILQSASIPKVFFDIRNDADALFAHFGVSVECVVDIQLMEVAARRYSKRYLAGLGKCIEQDAQLKGETIQQWKATKEKGVSLFAPERGGSYEIFNTRPLQEDIVAYCAQDVIYLPLLWDIYRKNINGAWAAKIKEQTRARLEMSKDASYDPHSMDKALSPWPPLGFGERS
ncbi:MAG: hypothetical protein Q9195_009521 [Heterodermia aff. obscurata]